MKTVLVCSHNCQESWELHSLSKYVSSVGDDLVVSYLPHFVAKTEHVDTALSRYFRVCSFRNFAGDLEEGSLLCPVCALRTHLNRTKLVVAHASTLFVSPRSRSCEISKNAVSFFLREVILGAGAVREMMKALPYWLTAIKGCPPWRCFRKTGQSLRC